MKAAFFAIGTKQFDIRNVEIPRINSDESLIQVRACGICGTDLHEYRRRLGIMKQAEKLAYSLIGKSARSLHGLEELRLGHEICGTVKETSLPELQDKQVVVFPDIPCGVCYACQHGLENVCGNFSNIGFQRPGGFAEYVAAPNKNICEISRKVDPPIATLAEPLACGLHAIEIAGVRKKDNVLVVGVGPIGLLIAYICREEYGSNVIACDYSSSRLDAALRMGVKQAITPKELVYQDLFPDVVFDVTGGQSQSINQIVQIVRPHGTICIEGFYEGIQGVSLRALQNREARIVTSRGSNKRNQQDAVAIVERHADKLGCIITKIFPLDEINQAFSYAANAHKTGAIKTVVKP